MYVFIILPAKNSKLQWFTLSGMLHFLLSIINNAEENEGLRLHILSTWGLFLNGKQYQLSPLALNELFSEQFDQTA